MITTLAAEHNLPDSELLAVINGGFDEELKNTADRVRREFFGDLVYIRGLIEISSICKNDCIYCGIRASNGNAARYRLTKEEILSCCKTGAELGFSTFVLQGGEDLYFTDDILCDIIDSIKKISPDAAVTLSVGERSRESYKALKNAGADRYLLRHETADSGHYARLHPEGMSLDTRKRCLYALKELGYQVGSGFMVGSPYQTAENILADIRFLQEIQPDMIGIGPFVPHKDAVRRISARQLRAYAAADFGFAAVLSRKPVALYNCTRHNFTRRQRKRSYGGCKCSNAEPFAPRGAKQIQFI